MEKLSYRFATNAIQCGKFAAVVADSGTYADGFALPAGQNAAAVLGIVQEGVVPHGFSEFSGGSYAGISQAAWPANAIPPTGQGQPRTVVREGLSKASAAGAINRGDWLVTADNQGRVASITTLGLAAGTAVNVVGQAEEAAVNANDVLRVWVNPHVRHV